MTVVVSPNIASLEADSARSLSFRNNDSAERAFGALSRDWDELLASCSFKGCGLPPLEVLLVRFEIGIHLEKPAECRN